MAAVLEGLQQVQRDAALRTSALSMPLAQLRGLRLKVKFTPNQQQ